MLPVGRAHRGHREPHAREVHALPAADDTSLDHAAPHVLGIPLGDDQADRAVGEHHGVADGELVHQRLVGDGELAGAAGLRAADERDMVSFDQVGRTAG